MKPQPDIRPVKESGKLYVLMESFIYGGINVPAGFRYDGASCARFLFQRDGMHRAAALIHDYIYYHRGHMKAGQNYTRRQADDLFYEMLKDYGIKSWHAWLAHKAVRAFGWTHWVEYSHCR